MSNTITRLGGKSIYGGDGGNATNTGGQDGQIPAGGGGSTRASGSSGAGARGQVEVYTI